MKKIELHWKIIIGMVLGLIFGFILLQFEGGKNFLIIGSSLLAQSLLNYLS